MVSDQSTDYRLFTEKLAELVSFQEITSVAVESGFIIRSRKVFPIEFILTLIFGFYSKEEPSISKFHRIYNSIVDNEKQVVYSSFYDRFSNEALTFVDKCLENYISNQMKGVNAELKRYLRTFKDVLIKDNTIVRVHSFLTNKYPATRTRRVTAGIKVSVLLSVVCNGPRSVKFFPEKTNDAKTLTVGPWVNGMLLFSLIENCSGPLIQYCSALWHRSSSLYLNFIRRKTQKGGGSAPSLQPTPEHDRLGGMGEHPTFTKRGYLVSYS